MKNFLEFFVSREKVSLFLRGSILQRGLTFPLLHLSKNLDVANPVGNAHTGQHSKNNLMFYTLLTFFD